MENSPNMRRQLFSERLLLVSDHVIGEYQRRFGDKTNVDLSSGDMTNLMYQKKMRSIGD
jgi:hypothetical protein